jgi:8-oxo-dGTP diphosphatase
MGTDVRPLESCCGTSGSWEIGCGRFRNSVAKPIKRSIAVLIRKGDLILSVRRADNDDELPGIWGLPAGSFRESESLADLIARIGLQKLGVSLTPIRRIAEGVQDRPGYQLQMELWEVAMRGDPSHSAFEWATIEVLKAGMDQGSLCCELAWKFRS